MLQAQATSLSHGCVSTATKAPSGRSSARLLSSMAFPATAAQFSTKQRALSQSASHTVRRAPGVLGIIYLDEVSLWLVRKQKDDLEVA
jgi:hypothetical protein